MHFSIGELSKKTGVKVPTIRYYEQEGLIAPPIRTDGNQRRYQDRDRERLAFIRHSRDLGLTMEAIRDLLNLSAHPQAPCENVDRIAADQLEAVRERIARLQRLETELARIVRSCDGHHPIAECNVMAAFSDHGKCDGDH
ncbi:MerR family transcriptional regulator [Roseibium limicola]|uniref:Helix-turn-helix domain-containing protein n=1 Tax=Roseibium limicola TaxID=2816037 RepID=A0A939ERX7_9HYPH|nr:helix-turn-helix domain-containing protein [Roseibium limicola]MBO0346473.1 helix-turn-helix domain-containing protein [Roseibium limicola]